jgi:hypothetical protein
MASMSRVFPIFCFLTFCLRADAPSTPDPPKADVPYLLMAQDLVSTDAIEAHPDVRNAGKKNEETTYSVPGEHATARTPLASPVFVMKEDTLAAERLSIYPFEIRNGRREITFSKKKVQKPFTLTPKKVGDALYRMEVNESLPPGEYAITPSGSNSVFCFGVF